MDKLREQHRLSNTSAIICRRLPWAPPPMALISVMGCHRQSSRDNLQVHGYPFKYRTDHLTAPVLLVAKQAGHGVPVGTAFA